MSRMTLTSVADVGMRRFEEYAQKHALKVRGIEPYNASETQTKKKGIEIPRPNPGSKVI